MSACPNLTELTVVPPYPRGAQLTKTGILRDPTGRARSAILELIVASKALPDFNTFQIICFPVVLPVLLCWCGQGPCDSHDPSFGHWEQIPKEDLEDRVIDHLKKQETGCREGGGIQKRVTLRVIKFSPGSSFETVEEYEV